MSIFEYDEALHLQLVRDEGRQENLIYNIKLLMKNTGKSYEDVCTLLEIPKEKYESLKALIK